MTKPFDPVRVEIFGNRLLAITDEMGSNLIRSSFSTNIKERKDCSVAIFSADGGLVAQASHIPIHLGSLHGGVKAVLAHYPPDALAPGDMFICNDPYTAEGTHTNDIAIIAPVFDAAGRMVFFAANLAHHTDVGGPVPGTGIPINKSIFHEGLRIPAVRYVRNGVVDESMMRLVCLNSRDPLERQRDLSAQVQTNVLGQRRLRELCAKFGTDKVVEAVRDLIGYSDARLAARLKRHEGLQASAEAWIDHDGLGGEPLGIAVQVAVQDGKVRFDFSGTSAQGRGAMNVPLSALRATCAYAVKVVFDPALPANEGLLERIEIVAPEGSLLNPRYPAAVASRASTCQRVVRAILLAFAKAETLAPVIAPSADMNAAMVLSGPRGSGEGAFVYLETLGGGGGAYPDCDGMHGVQMHMTNTSNLPAEAMELEYPLLVRTYGLSADSGGRGAYRGGAGIVREIEAAVDGIEVSARSDGMVTLAPGIEGGEDGGPAEIVLMRRDEAPVRFTEVMSGVVLRKGDVARIVTPGGAGYGDPARRRADLLEADRRNGF